MTESTGIQGCFYIVNIKRCKRNKTEDLFQYKTLLVAARLVLVGSDRMKNSAAQNVLFRNRLLISFTAL